MQDDVNHAMEWYDKNASEKIADEFFDELVTTMDKVAVNPDLCHPDSVNPKLKRVNLKQYPYHFLFKIQKDHIYIVVVRHDKRHWSFGHRRKY